MDLAMMVFWGGFAGIFLVVLVLRRLDQDSNRARLVTSDISAQDAMPDTPQRAPSLATWDRLRGLGAWATELKAQALLSRLQSTRMRDIGGLIPICAHCNTIRDDRGRWIDVVTDVEMRSDRQLTHGICPRCLPELRSSL
jgi:hypothetical protein